MAKNKQFTDNVKKGTLIALSMGIGASAVAPGMMPFQENGSHFMKVQAAEYVPGTLPAPNADIFKDAGDVSHYNFPSYNSTYYHNGYQTMSASLNGDIETMTVLDGHLYALSNTAYVGTINKYNKETRSWEKLYEADAPLYAIVKTADGNFIASGGKSGTYGEDYVIYSSIGNDQSWSKQISKYRSNTNNSTEAGIFRAGVAVEDDAVFFGSAGNWTFIQSTKDADNFAFKQEIYGNYNGAVYADGKVVAVGKQANDSSSFYGSIATASPGGNFSVQKMGYNENFQDVTYGDGKFVTVGTTGNMLGFAYVSTDGKSWTKATMPSGLRELNGVEYDEKNKRFVAVGRDGFVVSIDGKNWVSLYSPSYSPKDIALYDNVVDEYDLALFELGKVTAQISNASYQYTKLPSTSELQALLDSVVSDYVDDVKNEALKSQLMEQVAKNQLKLDALEIAISKHADFLNLVEEEAALVSPTLDEIKAFRVKVREFKSTLSVIPDNIIRNSFNDYVDSVVTENLDIKEAQIFVTRAETSYSKYDYDAAYAKVGTIVKYGSVAYNEFQARLKAVLADMPIQEATKLVVLAENSQSTTDFNNADTKVKALPSSPAKTELSGRLQLITLAKIETRLLPTLSPTQVQSIKNELNWITPVNQAVIDKKASVQQQLNPISDKAYGDYLELHLSLYIVVNPYNYTYSNSVDSAFANLTPEGKVKHQRIKDLFTQMRSNIPVMQAVEAAEKAYTDDNGTSYLNAMNKVEEMPAQFATLKDYLVDRLEELGDAKLQLTSTDEGVRVEYESKTEDASSYELLRDGKVVYSGSDKAFVDKETFSGIDYEYTLNIKDSNGEVVGTKTKSIKTQSHATLTATLVKDNVQLAFSSEKYKDVTFELVRNGSVIYEGNKNTFADKTASAASKHTYVLNVKNSTGTLVDKMEVKLDTPIEKPLNPQLEIQSPFVTKVTWGDGKNPEGTQYQVQATPIGAFKPTLSTLHETFETSNQIIPRTGAWSPSNVQKKTGAYSLKSSSIGNSQSSVSTFNFNLPENVTTGKVSFDYLVSSEQNYDFLIVTLNGVDIVKASGSGSWVSVEKPLKPGNNVLTVTYKKDSSGAKNYDAAFIDNLKATTANDGVEKSGWVNGNEFEFTNLQDGVEYEYTVVAKANGLTSEAAIAGATNPVEEAQEAVVELKEIIDNVDASNPEAIEEAQRGVDTVAELIEALPEDEEKENLQNQLNELQQQLDEAKELAEATKAIEELLATLPESMESRGDVEKAKGVISKVEELISPLPETNGKTVLVDRISDLKADVALAETTLNAKEAVAKLEKLAETLDNQAAVDQALVVLDETANVVSTLPEGNADRAELEGVIKDVKETIEKAQDALNVEKAKADVAKLGENLTQEAVDQAKVSIEKIKDGAVKEDLLAKIKDAQASLDVLSLLRDIASRKMDNMEAVNKAIKDLKSTEPFIASLQGQPAQKALSTVLEKAYMDAKWHTAEELEDVLSDNKTWFGKKAKLTVSEDALDLLVQYTIETSFMTGVAKKFNFLSKWVHPVVTEKYNFIHKGVIKGKVQPLVSSLVTGKQLNDSIAKYMD